MKKLLAVLGDAFHCPAHLVTALVRPLQMRGYDPTVVFDNAVPWDDLSSFDMVLISRYALDDVRIAREFQFNIQEGAKHKWLSEDEETRIEVYAQNGGRLFLHHDAVAFYSEGGGIQRVSKSRFHNHPKRIDVEIRPTGVLPELTDGVEPYCVREEEYIVDLDESQTSVFLESYSATNGRHVQGWCHGYGSGRVMVLVPGHEQAILMHPMTAKLIDNAITWLIA